MLGRWEVRHGGCAPAPRRRIRTAAGSAGPCHGSRSRRKKRRRMRRTAPRGTLRKIIKKHKPHLRLAANTDLLVHLSFLLFLHRLAEEARTNAFENKSKVIKPEHTIAAAKVILKKSRG